MISLRNKCLRTLLGVVAALSSFYSCDVYTSTKCPSYVVCYVNLETIVLSAEASDNKCIVINHGNDLPRYIYGLHSTDTDWDRYLQLCNKHNDVSYNKYRLLNKTSDVTSVAYNDCDFEAIEVTSDKDFDGNHSAGENMSDIVRFMSWSPYKYILSGYTDIYNFNNNDVSSEFTNLMRIYLGEDFLDPSLDSECHPIDKLLKDLGSEDLVLVGHDAPGFIGMLYFENEPEQKGEYKITVSIKTDDGRVLTDSLIMSFE